MIKVGEHVTLDIIGTKKEYNATFFEGLVHKIAEKAKVTVLNIAKYKFEPHEVQICILLYLKLLLWLFLQFYELNLQRMLHCILSLYQLYLE